MEPVLDHGFVKLEGALADDASVARAARVSFAREAEEAGDVAGLVSFLMRERHGTPFEHNAFRFVVKAPLFVTREWMRHRVGSYNEQSGRYSVLQGEFYVPAEVRAQVGKPGAYTFEPLDGEVADQFLDDLRRESSLAYARYEGYAGAGVAKELARLFLPVNVYTRFYWTVNARSLMNFLSLRNAPQAQAEIRAYAEVVEGMFFRAMPITCAAFVEFGRVAP